MFKKTFEIRPDLIVQVERIDPKTIFRNKNKYKLIPIKNSAYYNFGSLRSEYNILAEVYAGLTYISGESDSYYDSFKSSYSFTFMLKVKKNNLPSEYIYHIYHYRSYIEFDLRQIVCKEDSRDSNAYADPNDALFSDEDICYFSNFFCYYSLGFMQGAAYTPEPFVKYSDSNFLIFGYFENEYFICDYEDQHEYKEAKKKLLDKVSHEKIGNR
jgi:hypothetical protein